MIIDCGFGPIQPRRGVMLEIYVIPTGLGYSALQYYNRAIPSGLFTA